MSLPGEDQHHDDCRRNTGVWQRTIMKRHIPLSPTLFIFCCLVGPTLATEYQVAEPFGFAGGRMVVAWPQSSSAPLRPSGRYELLIHFHGDPNIVIREAGRANFQGVVAVLNFPGLSSAYRRPFERDASLFEQVLVEVGCELRRARQIDAQAMEGTVVVSSFSAGYGAVREILKSRSNLARLQGYIAADSIYASLVSSEKTQPAQTKRSVQPTQMKDFLELAKRASVGEKFFLLTHSAQSTPYASTTETANYLLDSLSIQRKATTEDAASWHPTSQAQRRGFHVLGYAGTSGQDHLRHLRSIGDAFLRIADIRKSLAAPDKSSTVSTESTRQLFHQRGEESYSWLRGTQYEDPQRVFNFTDSEVRITGQHAGYLATHDRFENYRLSLEFKWGTQNVKSRRANARDSGLFLHAHGTDGNSADGDGAFMSAIECQIMEAAVGDLMLIRAKKDEDHPQLRMTALVAKDDDTDGWPYVITGRNWPTRSTDLPTSRRIERWGRLNRWGKRRDWKDAFELPDNSGMEAPKDEWNHMIVRCVDDVIVVAVNNQMVNAVSKVSPTMGKILLQSEGSEIFFRRVCLAELGGEDPTVGFEK